MDRDISEESSDLFKSLLGGLNAEQWEEYKLQKKLESGCPLDDDDDDDEEDMDLDYGESFILESHSSSPCNFDDEVVTKFDVEKDDLDKVADDDDCGENELSFHNIEWNSDIAVKYVNGDIDFNSLTEKLEKSNKARKELDFGNDDDDNIDDGKGTPTKKRQRRRIYQLPKDFRGLMGAANMSFADGEYEVAIEKCLSIINVVPHAQAPFEALSLIYHEMGDSSKALQFALIAAYFNPVDSDEWSRLANMSIEHSHFQQAIKCFTLALRIDPTNVNLLWQRCSLYEQLGEKKNALASYKLILQNLNNSSDGEGCIELARSIAKVHHKYKDSINAVKVLESVYAKFSALVTYEDANMLLEHLMKEKLYKSALKNLVLHCGVTIEVDRCTISAENINAFDTDDWKEIIRCTFHECLFIDLKVKLLVVLIYVKALNVIDNLMEDLKKENPEDIGDLYLDVTEALMEVGEYSAAKPLLSLLVNTHKYNAPIVWLKYADCLNMLCEKSEAIEAYERVLRLAPCYQEARIPLSKLKMDSGDKRAAADALKQEYENGNLTSVVDLIVLVQRAEMLYELGCYDNFIAAAKLILLSHCYLVKTDEEIQCVLNNQAFKRRREGMREIIASTANYTAPTFKNQDVSAQNLWDIFFKLCEKLFEFKHFNELQAVALTSMTSEMWKKLERTKDAECLGLLACFYNGNYRFSYILIRDLIFHNLKNNRYFNLLCLNVLKMQTVRHNKFCLRLMAKNPEHIALGLFNGHNAMVAGSYKLALGEYGNILKKMPDNPEINFYVGINYIHMASQKFATKRPFLIIQGISILHKYVQLRNYSQESLYNAGRACHQLGIQNTALQFYKMALETPPVIIENEPNEKFDLSREIAFNIGIIYQASGEEQLSFMYYRAYNVV